MKNLRGLRLAHGLSLKALGEKLGLAESTVSLYESGKREPDFATLNKLAEIFSVPVDFILSGDACDWGHEDLYEDFEHADDSTRLIMVEHYGIPYRFAADYFRILNERRFSLGISTATESSSEPSKAELIFRSLSPEKQEEALRYMEYLADHKGK